MVLDAICTTALNDLVIPLHPGRGIKTPPVPRKPRRIVTAEQFQALHEAIADPVMQLLVETAIESGLVDKIAGYNRMARSSKITWPVLCWLHSARREDHLHVALNHVDVNVPVATATRDNPHLNADAGPAGAIWHPYRANQGPLSLHRLPQDCPLT